MYVLYMYMLLAITVHTNRVGLQVRLQYVSADGQVAGVEGVFPGPALLAEPAPTEDDRVEPVYRVYV